MHQKQFPTRTYILYKINIQGVVYEVYYTMNTDPI